MFVGEFCLEGTDYGTRISKERCGKGEGRSFVTGVGFESPDGGAVGLKDSSATAQRSKERREAREKPNEPDGVPINDDSSSIGNSQSISKVTSVRRKSILDYFRTERNLVISNQLVG